MQLLIDHIDYTWVRVGDHFFHPTGFESLLTTLYLQRRTRHDCQDLECNFETQEKGRRVIGTDNPVPVLPAGRFPRFSRLMALAHRYDRLVVTGEVKDYAELARLGQVSRARITQIMNLLLLAPDIQEEILFLPNMVESHDPIKFKRLKGFVWRWTGGGRGRSGGLSNSNCIEK